MIEDRRKTKGCKTSQVTSSGACRSYAIDPILSHLDPALHPWCDLSAEPCLCRRDFRSVPQIVELTINATELSLPDSFSRRKCQRLRSLPKRPALESIVITSCRVDRRTTCHDITRSQSMFIHLPNHNQTIVYRTSNGTATLHTYRCIRCYILNLPILCCKPSDGQHGYRSRPLFCPDDLTLNVPLVDRSKEVDLD
jgi:hypothetical protein